MAADLVRDHTVVVPDLRGLGLSSKPASGFDKKTQAGDVAGWYHDFERLSEKEEELRFHVSGVVISRRLHTHCKNGDCLVQVGRLIKG
ncbi:MAG: succinylglutamate desuccinylase/aspartoacylase family protein [Rhizobium pusense]|nr:succinylglutamate desuccinylase/aspartoacylase family protein [Agrobacterium pusense]